MLTENDRDALRRTYELAESESQDCENTEVYVCEVGNSSPISVWRENSMFCMAVDLPLHEYSSSELQFAAFNFDSVFKTLHHVLLVYKMTSKTVQSFIKRACRLVELEVEQDDYAYLVDIVREERYELEAFGMLDELHCNAEIPWRIDDETLRDNNF